MSNVVSNTSTPLAREMSNENNNEKDGNWQINSETIQDDEVTIYRTSYKRLDGYPSSLGFPIMHRVHAICIQSIIAIT